MWNGFINLAVLAWYTSHIHPRFSFLTKHRMHHCWWKSTRHCLKMWFFCLVAVKFSSTNVSWGHSDFFPVFIMIYTYFPLCVSLKMCVWGNIRKQENQRASLKRKNRASDPCLGWIKVTWDWWQMVWVCFWWQQSDCRLKQINFPLDAGIYHNLTGLC